MLSTILKITMTALGLFKSLVQWWREKSIHDAAIKAERARLAEAEIKANEKMDDVKPDSRDDLVKRLRDNQF